MKVLMDKLAENIRLTLFSLSLDEFAFRSQTHQKTKNQAERRVVYFIIYFTLDFLF